MRNLFSKTKQLGNICFSITSLQIIQINFADITYLIQLRMFTATKFSNQEVTILFNLIQWTKRGELVAGYTYVPSTNPKLKLGWQSNIHWSFSLTIVTFVEYHSCKYNPYIIRGMKKIRMINIQECCGGSWSHCKIKIWCGSHIYKYLVDKRYYVFYKNLVDKIYYVGIKFIDINQQKDNKHLDISWIWEKTIRDQTKLKRIVRKI